MANAGNAGSLYYSDHNFLTSSTWMSDVADITPIFNPGYNCSSAVGFNEDQSYAFIKSCDNNNPATLCCNANTLDQIRGQPLQSAESVERVYSNLASIKAYYRCFVKL